MGRALTDIVTGRGDRAVEQRTVSAAATPVLSNYPTDAPAVDHLEPWEARVYLSPAARVRGRGWR